MIEEELSIEDMLINGEMSKKILMFLYENKLEKFDTSILGHKIITFNYSTHYKILLRLENLGIIKKNKVALHNKNIYEIINKEKLEQLTKKIVEKS
jgi:predicted transcriptional regulator